MTEIKKFFNETLGRPELLNRFGENFVVFDFIRPEMLEQIIEKNLEKIKEKLQEKKIHLEVEAKAMKIIKAEGLKNLAHGGRGVGNSTEEKSKLSLRRGNKLVNCVFSGLSNNLNPL